MIIIEQLLPAAFFLHGVKQALHLHFLFQEIKEVEQKLLFLSRTFDWKTKHGKIKSTGIAFFE